MLGFVEVKDLKSGLRGGDTAALRDGDENDEDAINKVLVVVCVCVCDLKK